MNRKNLILLLFIFTGMIFISCNDDSTSTENDEEKDRGVALESMVYSYVLTLDTQLNQVRWLLMDERQNIDTDNLPGNSNLSILKSIHNLSVQRVNISGLIDTNGRIIRAYPEEYDTLLAEVDFHDHNEFQLLLDSPTSFYISAVQIDQDSSLFFDYMVPVTEFDGEEILRSILWTNCDFDIITSYAFAAVQHPDSIPKSIFLIDDTGRIIYDKNRSLIGKNFLDSEIFGEDNAELCQQMLDENSGNSIYYSDHAPGDIGNGGESYIGWNHFNQGSTFWKNGSWIIALTELKEQ